METYELLQSHADAFKNLYATKFETIGDGIYVAKSETLQGRNWNRGFFTASSKSFDAKSAVEKVAVELSTSDPCIVLVNGNGEGQVRNYLSQNGYQISYEDSENWMVINIDDFSPCKTIRTDLTLSVVSNSEEAKEHFKAFNEIFNAEEYNSRNCRNLKEVNDEIIAEFNRKSESIQNSYKNGKVAHIFAKRYDISIGCSTISLSEDGMTAGVYHFGLKHTLFRADDIFQDQGVKPLMDLTLRTAFKMGAKTVLFNSDDSSINTHKRMGASVGFKGKVIAFNKN